MRRFHRLAPLLAGLLVAACGARGAMPTPAAVAVMPTAEPTANDRPPTANATMTMKPVPTATRLPLPTGKPPTPTAPPISSPAPSPTPCAQPGRVEHGTFDSAVAGEAMRYRIYLPPCYGLDGHVYRTLYMFGGNIHDDAIWDDLGLDEAAEAAITRGDIPPLLIVMPDNGWLANTTTSGPNSYEGFAINELIPHIETTYCAWPGRDGRAVGGLSRGGYWSLMMAFRRPDLFRSVGGHSPALIDSYAGPAEDPVITGGINDLGDLRIWIDIGERDPYLADARPLHDTLTAAGVEHEWQVNPGTHDEAYWRANLAGYVEWYSEGWQLDRAALPACERP